MNSIKKNGLWLILIIIPIIFIGCSNAKPPKVIRVLSFSISESKGFGVTITTNLELLNPNRSPLTIKKADIDVYVEGVFLGKLIVPENLKIPAKEIFTTELKIDVNFSTLLSAGKNVMKKIQSKSFEVSFKGNLQVKYFFYNKDIKVDATNKVEL